MDTEDHQYGTINTHLAAILTKNDESDAMISRFMKETSKIQPIEPKCNTMW